MKHLPDDSTHTPSSQPDDQYLLSNLMAGDEAALRALMNRYDKLVRYIVFKRATKQCSHDPQWLEMVASNTWMGFVRSLQRNPEKRPQNLKAYLLQIAKNQTLSAIRSLQSTNREIQTLDGGDDPSNTVSIESPDEILSNLDDLEALRGCFEKLNPDQKKMISQLDAITNRRWKEAATALKVQESTLRSRWVKLLDHLKRCMDCK